MASDPIVSSPTGVSARSVFGLRNMVLAVVVVLVGAVGVLVYSVSGLTPGQSGKFNAQLLKLVEDAQSDTAGEANSWDEFVGVTRVYTQVNEVDAGRAKPSDWPEGLKWPASPDEASKSQVDERAMAEYRAVLRRYGESGVYGKLDGLAGARRFVRGMPKGKLLSVRNAEFEPVIGLGRVCKARMTIAAKDGDEVEFVRAATHLFVLGEICKKQYGLLDQTSGVILDGFAARAIREAVGDHALSARVCRELLTLIEERVTRVDDVRAMKGATLIMRDTVEWTHSDDGNGDGRALPAYLLGLAPGSTIEPNPQGGFKGALANIGSIVLPKKKDTNAALDKVFAAAEKYVATPLRERLAESSPEALAQSLSVRYMLVKVWSQEVGPYYKIADKGDVEIAGTKIMLALELHREAQGEYPSSLAGMDPSVESLKLRQIWRDEIVYRRFKAGEDAEGKRAYVLYWIGMDGVDDGGHAHESGQSSFAWGEGSGVDLVFNLRRRAGHMLP